jgi:hypothetical protein
MRLPIALSRKALLAGALIAGLAALLAALLATQLGGPAQAGAADHRDAPGLTPPGGDVRADINDVYAFQASNPNRTAIVVTVNGLTAANTPVYFGRGVPGINANKRILYYINVDNDGDAIADVVYRLRFGKPRNGVQKFELMRGNRVLIPLSNGRTTRFNASPQSSSGGGARVFAGVSEDPFFFDLPGFINIAKGLDALGLDSDPTNNAESFIGCTGSRTDFFAGLNVSSIVLEVPDSQLTAGGTGNTVGIWATTTIGGQQVDRMGRPAVATVFIPNNPIPPDNAGSSMKSAFNTAQPQNDQAAFRTEVVNTLTTLFSLNDAGGPLGGTDDASNDATAIGGLADILLPDLLTYDVTMSGGFLNGRRLADDVIDAELNLVTEGLITGGDCVAANDATFRAGFPYVAAPNT